MATNSQRDELHGIPMTEEAFERLVSAESPYQAQCYVSCYEVQSSGSNHF